MDSYVYAPKDDYKHRAYWREMYTVEEADHLTSKFLFGVKFHFVMRMIYNIHLLNRFDSRCKGTWNRFLLCTIAGIRHDIQ